MNWWGWVFSDSQYDELKLQLWWSTVVLWTWAAVCVRPRTRVLLRTTTNVTSTPPGKIKGKVARKTKEMAKHSLVSSFEFGYPQDDWWVRWPSKVVVTRFSHTIIVPSARCTSIDEDLSWILGRGWLETTETADSRMESGANFQVPSRTCCWLISVEANSF